jgi:hypothetical protein
MKTLKALGVTLTAVVLLAVPLAKNASASPYKETDRTYSSYGVPSQEVDDCLEINNTITVSEAKAEDWNLQECFAAFK